MFPELADAGVPDDNAPSCSVAEALERQSLFVNRVVASHALALLFVLLGRGSIGNAGAFINLASGQVVPIALPRPRSPAATLNRVAEKSAIQEQETPHET